MKFSIWLEICSRLQSIDVYIIRMNFVLMFETNIIENQIKYLSFFSLFLRLRSYGQELSNNVFKSHTFLEK